MSVGFVPVILSLLSGEFLAQELSLCIGAGAGVLSSLYSVARGGRRIPQIILYATTGILLLMSVAALVFPVNCPRHLFPLALEISILIPMSLLFLHQGRLPGCPAALRRRFDGRLFAQGIEAAIVSARVILIIGLLHFLILFSALTTGYPLGDTVRRALFHVAPLLVFILGILFNQFGIFYFNRVMERTTFVPIVNTQGDVIGKIPASEAFKRKGDYIHPVVRIAVTSHGMLFLRPRPGQWGFEKRRSDLLMEGYLNYGETLEQGVHRILRQTLPTAPADRLHFNFMYRFKTEATNRLVYLFTLDLDDDVLLRDPDFRGGKLWTLRQMEHNLGKGFFSSCLEEEFEQLESIIYTREKYKES